MAEELDPGFERLPSGTLRVRIRLKGLTAQESFPLHKDTPAVRKDQMAAARLWAAKTRSAINAGSYIDNSALRDLTVEDILKAFSTHGLTHSKESNARKDRNRVNLVLKDRIASMKVLAVHTGGLNAYANELIARRYEKDEQEPARTTLYNQIGVITRAMNFARETYPTMPKVALPKLPPPSPGRDRRLMEGELEAILEISRKKEPVLTHAVLFAIETALRKDRVLGFKEVYARSIGCGNRVIRFPKGKKSEKTVGIIPVTHELHALMEDAKRDLGGNNQVDRLFDISLGRFDKMWQETLELAGIKDLHFHDLRHEATSRLFESGLTMAEVMSITGHSTTEMVQRYSHYNAVVVLEKQNRRSNLLAITDEISKMIDLFLRSGGDRSVVDKMLDSMTMPMAA
ncbi:site-specific integrase [Bosea sp. 2KB_26]|uniref:site-specific integrase n=1 Tax=Bosea sp. 2KB_26 TaxID=3237475 RepID=UPI003F8DEF9E